MTNKGNNDTIIAQISTRNKRVLIKKKKETDSILYTKKDYIKMAEKTERTVGFRFA